MLRQSNTKHSVAQSIFVDRVDFSDPVSLSGVTVVGFRPPKSVRLDQISLFIDNLDSGSITVKTLLNKEVIGTVNAVEGGNTFPDSITIKALDRLEVVFSVDEMLIGTMVKGIYFSYVMTDA